MKQSIIELIIDINAYPISKAKQKFVLALHHLQLSSVLFNVANSALAHSSFQLSFIHNYLTYFFQFTNLQAQISTLPVDNLTLAFQLLLLSCSAVLVMSVAGAILLIYLRIQQKKAKLESRRSSALKLVKHAFTLTIATVADIYPWLCLQTILSNSSSCLLADEYLTKAIALANILLGVLLGLFFLIYTLRKQHDQQNILIVRKRESNILMLALQITLYLLDGIVTATKQKTNDEQPLLALIILATMILYDGITLFFFIGKSQILFERLKTHRVYIQNAFIRFPLTFIALIMFITGSASLHNDIFFSSITAVSLPLLIKLLRLFWNFKLRRIINEHKHRLSKSSPSQSIEEVKDMIFYLKKLSNFDNPENKMIVCEIITNHLILCNDIACDCWQSDFIVEGTQEFRKFAKSHSSDKESSQLLVANYKSRMTVFLIRKLYFELLIAYLKKILNSSNNKNELVGQFHLPQFLQIFLINFLEQTLDPGGLFKQSVILCTLFEKNKDDHKLSLHFREIQKKAIQQECQQVLVKATNMDLDIPGLFSFDQQVVLCGNEMLKALKIKQEIIALLYSHYQHPLPLHLDELMLKYIKVEKRCLRALQKCRFINEFANQTQLLERIFYKQNDSKLHFFRCIYFDVDEQAKLAFRKNLRFQIKEEQKSLVDISNQLSSLVISAFRNNQLIIVSHSSLFPYMTKHSEAIGKSIEILVPQLIKPIHHNFVEHFISNGKPLLLQAPLIKLFYDNATNFVTESSIMIRIDTSNLNELRIIALFSNKPDQGAFFTANDEGDILQYSEIAATQLKINIAIAHWMQRRRLRIQPDANSIQEYAKKLNLEFLSPYLINRDDQEELSIPMGLIIVPCQLMISKHHYSHLYTNLSSKQQTTNLSQKDKELLGFYKYFLKFPEDCFVFSSSIYYKRHTFDNNSIMIQTASFTAFKEIKEPNMKVFALELILKMVIKKLNVQQETYTMTQTFYKVASQEEQSECNIDSENESFFKMPEEQYRRFLPDAQEIIGKYDNEYEQVVPTLLSPRSQGGELISQAHEFEDDRYDTVQLQFPNEVSRYSRQYFQKEINIEEISDMKINEEIQRIRQDLKKMEKLEKKMCEFQNIQLNSQKNAGTQRPQTFSLLNYLIKSFETQKPEYKLKFLSGFYILIVNLIIVINLSLIVSNFSHLAQDSQNQSLALTVFQDINVFQIAIQNLDLANHDQYNHFEMLEKRKIIGIEYLSFALVEYRNEILQIFVLEEERHYFISILDQTYFTLNTSDQLYNMTISYFLQNFIIDILLELQSQSIDEFEITGFAESIIHQNYFQFIELLKLVRIMLDDEVVARIKHIDDLSLLVIFINIILCTINIFLISQQVNYIIRWKKQLSSSFFFFQPHHLEEQIVNSAPQVQAKILRLKEIQYTAPKTDFNISEFDKAKLLNRMEKEQNIKREKKLGRIFYLQLISIIFILFLIGVLYFLPFTIYLQNQYRQKKQMNFLIQKICQGQLGISTDLSLFLRKINILMDEGNQTSSLKDYDNLLWDWRTQFEQADIFLFENLPSDQNYQKLDTSVLKMILQFYAGDVCELTVETEFLNFVEMFFYESQILVNKIIPDTTQNCSNYFDGSLKKGFIFYNSQIEGLLKTWNEEVFGRFPYDTVRAKEILFENNDFQQICSSFQLILKYQTFIKKEVKKLIHTSNEKTVTNFNLISLISMSFIFSTQTFLFLWLMKKLKEKILIAKKLVRLLNHRLINKNKHLMAFLQGKIDISIRL